MTDRPSQKKLRIPRQALFTFAQLIGVELDNVDLALECPFVGVSELKMKTAKPKATIRPTAKFDAQQFLDTSGMSRKVMDYRRGESIYTQGDAAETVMYIQKGGVKLSVVNGSGKEAVVAMFGPGDFFGEGCMAGQTLRMGTTSAVTPSTLLVIQKMSCCTCFTRSTNFPTISFRTCWRITFAWKKI
jgi:hypothetical protein